MPGPMVIGANTVLPLPSTTAPVVVSKNLSSPIGTKVVSVVVALVPEVSVLEISVGLTAPVVVVVSVDEGGEYTDGSIQLGNPVVSV